MKYGPECPDRFQGYEYSREFRHPFFDSYNKHHRHSGIAFYSSADVHYKRVAAILAKRQDAMKQAFVKTPLRFSKRQTNHKEPSRVVWSNPPENGSEFEIKHPHLGTIGSIQIFWCLWSRCEFYLRPS